MRIKNSILNILLTLIVLLLGINFLRAMFATGYSGSSGNVLSVRFFLQTLSEFYFDSSAFFQSYFKMFESASILFRSFSQFFTTLSSGTNFIEQILAFVMGIFYGFVGFVNFIVSLVGTLSDLLYHTYLLLRAIVVLIIRLTGAGSFFGIYV